MKSPGILAPLRRGAFRQLWVGMSLSYAGDRLQELAQAWLVATLTQSALAVAGPAILASIPQLLMPLGGVIADQVNRRRLLIVGQWVGATLTLIIAVLVFTGSIAIWHIYVWAFISGVIWLFSRPAYKVVLTEAVPQTEVRSAAAINSVTETSAMVAVNVTGSLLLAFIGLPIAFLLNSLSYAAAGIGLAGLRDADHSPVTRSRLGAFSAGQILTDLRDGLSYLLHQPQLLRPLLLTFLTVAVTSPTFGLLAAIVHAQGGSIIGLGLLSAAGSLGSLIGAI